MKTRIGQVREVIIIGNQTQDFIRNQLKCLRGEEGSKSPLQATNDVYPCKSA